MPATLNAAIAARSSALAGNKKLNATGHFLLWFLITILSILAVIAGLSLPVITTLM
jgi:hypothetical protein